ncbi:MAG: hypothetical protein IPN39_06530 [Chitinophagaceae bacterium]|nr:hypothetical protein [Chitinophagaceae bacterium]
MSQTLSINRFRTFISFLVIFALGIIIINACSKSDRIDNGEGKPFDIAAAKEWWYSEFKNSSAYNYRDKNSLFIAPVELGSKANKKYPSWKRGINYKIGSFEIVELPLFYNNPVIIFPGSDKLPEGEKIRIAKASINKTVVIKNSNKKVIVRTVTLIPSLGYAQEKNYDISANTLQHPDKKFSGWVVVKDWHESLIGYWQIENGRKVRQMKMERKKQVDFPVIEQEVCEYVLVEQVAEICVGDIIIGDEPGAVPECTQWVYQTSYDWEWSCYEVGGGGGDPMEDCLNLGLTSEECICQLLGIGCGNSGGGEGPPPNPDQVWLDNNIKDSTDNPCVNEVLDKLKIINEKLPKLIRDFFSLNPAFNMNIKMENVGPNNSVWPEGGHSDFVFGANTFDVFINGYYQNATDLSIAATILHEALHCQLYYMYNESLNNPAILSELATTYGIIFPDVFQGNSSLEAIINGLNPAQHQAIIELFSTHLSEALYQFAQAQGIQITKNECKDLAWAGTLIQSLLIL